MPAPRPRRTAHAPHTLPRTLPHTLPHRSHAAAPLTLPHRSRRCTAHARRVCLQVREGGLRDMLELRERQLAVMVTHLDASRTEVASARRHAGGDLAQLRAALSRRQAELVTLVRELYKLAAAEKDSGAVCFAARSRLFNQSATIYRSLGPEAFAELEQDDDAENAPPP